MENNTVNSNNTVSRDSRNEDSIDLGYIVDVVWDLKYWMNLSVFLFLAAGYIYLKFKTPQYTRSATVLITNDRMTGGAGLEMQLLSDITGEGKRYYTERDIHTEIQATDAGCCRGPFPERTLFPQG